MPRRAILSLLCFWSAIVWFGIGTCSAAEIDFNRDIRPILSEACFLCHGPDANHRKAELRLDQRDSAIDLQAIVPGKPEASELVARILSNDPAQIMPPPKSNKKLTDGQKEKLRQWVIAGAEYQSHWAFLSPRRAPIPVVKSAGWGQNEIDAFVLSRLEREGLQPSPAAPLATLLRRVSLDLTGLPPTPEETAVVLADKSPDAYERAVDRLLASPAFGERMAWDWMEASRYADSNGYQGDTERTMWPWRDWVVKSFNENLPFDQFTVLQLAGDLLPSATAEQKLATGFCRNHPINGEGGRIAEENRVDYVMDMAETTGTIWLGLTFNCSRCHDHKFDAITRRDYYSLFAFFNQTPVTGEGRDGQTAPVIEMSTAEEKSKLAALGDTATAQAQAVDELEKTVFPRPDGKTVVESEKATGLPDRIKEFLKKAPLARGRGEIEELQKHFAEPAADYAKKLGEQRAAIELRDAFRRSLVRVMVMEELPKPRQTFVLEKGLYNKPGDEVSQMTPASLPAFSAGAPRNRLGLAQWLVSRQNPLTPRVTVNRFWQSIFGVGLVKTADDFGVQGEFPTHPELLDWLAVEFQESNWDVKRILRLIVTSATYRQASRVSPQLLERDPENRLLTRGPRFRMPSWMLRDQALAAGGLLVSKLAGPAVNSYQPPGVWEETTFGRKSYQQDHGDALYRRSLYTFWRRIIGPTVFFDTSSRSVCAVKPTRTNTPLHALATLNDVTYVEAARAMAERVMSHSMSPAERADFAFRLVLNRSPEVAEKEVVLAGLERVKIKFAARPDDAKQLLAIGETKRNEQLEAVEQAAYTVMCLGILNLDEALTKE